MIKTNPNTKTLKHLHQQLIDGDQSVSNTLCELLLDLLSVALNRKFPQIDEDILSDCITDSIIEYLKLPSKFDPSKGPSLDSFLLMASIRNVQDFSKKSATYSKKRDEYREFLQIFVAEDGRESNIGLEEEEFVEMKSELLSVLPASADQKFFEAQLNGEKDIGVYAQILGLENSSKETQKVEVKHARDRISKVLKRYVQNKRR